MKIGFFGTPEIAAYCLEKLAPEHEITFIVTGLDKKTGRHQKLTMNPVKKFALANGIEVIQPDNINDPGLVRELKTRNAGIFVVVAYGKIIPRNNVRQLLSVLTKQLL